MDARNIILLAAVLVVMGLTAVGCSHTAPPTTPTASASTSASASVTGQPGQKKVGAAEEVPPPDSPAMEKAKKLFGGGQAQTP